ncbi:MAG: hypothetical protein OXG15_14845, partial [Gammaproteobacteria bacterium]|nr:hypothetical protein [Gammaproteobacteria bacterium]
DRFDEFKQNGFEDEQARVIAMAIDETVEDRLNGVLAHIDARFDGINAQLKGVDAQLKGVVTGFAGVEAQLRARKFEIAALVITSAAALIGIGLAAYEYGIKPLLGST